MSYRIIASMLVVMAVPVALAAPLQDLLPNGGFDTDIAGWSTLPPSGSSPVWSSEDCCGDSSSGSIELRAIAQFVVAGSSCIAVLGGTDFDLVTMVDTRPTGGLFGQAGIQIRWYSDAGCTTETGSWQSWALGGQQGWRRFGTTTTAPPDAMAAAIVLIAAGNGLSNGIDAFFDDIAFGESGTVPVRLQSFDVD